MDDHVYKSSLFWFVVTKASEVAYFFGPWVILAGTIVWAIRSKTWPGYLALLGGLLVAGAHLAHETVPMVHTINLGGQLPAADENRLIVFFYLHGSWFGTLFLGAAILAHFIRKPSVA